jgi:hypothetical protein
MSAPVDSGGGDGEGNEFQENGSVADDDAPLSLSVMEVVGREFVSCDSHNGN